MQVDKIARLLPEIFQTSVGSNGPLDAFLETQSALHAPCEAVLGNYPNYFDPRRAPVSFLYLLAHWVDLDYLLEGPKAAPHFPSGEGRLRELVCLVAQNAKQRGSAQGIERMLTVATGLEGFACIEGGTPFQTIVRMPKGAGKYQAMIAKIIAAEKPAFTECTTIFFDNRDELPTSD